MQKLTSYLVSRRLEAQLSDLETKPTIYVQCWYVLGIVSTEILMYTHKETKKQKSLELW